MVAPGQAAVRVPVWLWGWPTVWSRGAPRPVPTLVSQSVSYFTVPPRAHPSTGSQSGSATEHCLPVEHASTEYYSLPGTTQLSGSLESTAVEVLSSTNFSRRRREAIGTPVYSQCL